MNTTHTIRVQLKLSIACEADVGPATLAIAIADALAGFHQCPLTVIGEAEVFVNDAIALEAEEG